ncbi:ATP-dependent helicase HrpB [Pseudoclavibacter chungangensis]|uniref:ATP-dependent helicase HrpB n=1 Tax=Pseudoclavibacter chungangensis TaxID=587635 RepID=A0A7J5BYN0_9MICO|nr:ATP-dependent helicase HrpB [Pseudoclavibacter chungangensis]KAB1659452.1 ATP-dependent helicase HrpB [Pseudoclavibacter chungangensis]NYJ67695.1 ATP-dependent helicase HrpB [Pseudoclavibacter chungangensis]
MVHERARAPFELGRIGSGLPFAGALDALRDAIEHSSGAPAAVVQAPPGSGKTTLVPPLVTNLVAGRGSTGRVVVTQPRRVAVRAAARRLASLDGSPLGARAGYTVRGDRRIDRGAQIEFVTPGVLLRRVLDDPGLDGVAAVVLDEVHERSLDTDLLVGLLGEVRQLRDDLVVVAMSATVDAQRFAELLPAADGTPAPLVDSPAQPFPLEVRWRPGDGPRLDERGVVRGFLDHVADETASTFTELRRRHPDADALVFVPGAREVRLVAERLRRTVRGAEVLELHGRAPTAQQDRAIAGRSEHDPPRIVVSTAVAESSLTVPGVRLVVDSGLARVPRRDSVRGMTGLVSRSASRASSEQRAGRAARQGPGVVVRCFDERTFAAAPAHPTPEIASADLVEAALLLACWGAPGGVGLSLPDAPPALAMSDALAVLQALGAVDDAGRATGTGHELARIPADPRLGRALVVGAGPVGAREAAEVTALVGGDVRADGGDLTTTLRALRAGRHPDEARWRADVERLERIARWHTADRTGTAPEPPGPSADRRTATTAERTDVGLVVALAYPDRVARLVDRDASVYLLASGTRAALPPGGPLDGAPWLAVAEAARAQGRVASGTGAVVRSAAWLDEATAVRAAEPLRATVVAASFEGGRVTVRREERIGAILRSSTPVTASGGADERAAVEAALASSGLDVIGWSAAADALRRRLGLLHRELGDPWPDVGEEALRARLDGWLAPEIGRLTSGVPASRIDLADPLRRLLPWPAAARLDELVPERLAVPSGSHVRIDYPSVDDPDGRPVVAVKLQECFGWAQTPRLVAGRVPVLFHLLSPAGRPVAVTDDLASFWSGPYAQVRAEMRGRYPKHPWPEDPWAATPTRRTTRGANRDA